MNLQKIMFSFLLLFLIAAAGCRTLFETPMDAATAYQSKQYIVASDLLIDEYKKESSLIEQSKIAYKIAECFRLANRTDKAEEWYDKAAAYNPDPQIPFKYALMLKKNGKYDAAIREFRNYMLSNSLDRTSGAREMQACKQAKEWAENLGNYRLFNLDNVNSKASDFAPALYMDKQLVFTSSRANATGEDIYGWTGEKHSDLFVSERISDLKYSQPIFFGDSINTAYNEGTATFSPDYKMVYFTACGSANAADDYCKIYYTYKNESGKFILPEPLDLFNNDTINVGQPFLTPDGAQLYFSADAPDGYGDKDIYVSTKQRDGFWGEPKNIGPEINTAGYDGFPYIGHDGKLYFASDGHLGMGGLDIFAATRDGKRWTNPQNMQAPINSAADDFGLILMPFIKPALLDSIEMMGYFCSSRKGGKGNDDIYKFVLEIPQEPKIDTTIIVEIPPDTIPEVRDPQITYVLRGKVLQKVLENPNDPNSRVLSSAPIPSAVAEILGLDFSSNIAKRLVTNSQGEFTITLEPNTDYKVTGSQSGYFTKSENVTTKGRKITDLQRDTTIQLYAELTLDKIYKQQEIVLENIYFDLDKDNIRPDARPTLDKLVVLLIENPRLVIEMGSHTDSRGSDSYNRDLSQRRAQSTVEYLVIKGIHRARLIARGYGETQLVNGCEDGVNCSEEEHQRNRRTTFKVVSDRFSGGGLDF